MNSTYLRHHLLCFSVVQFGVNLSHDRTAVAQCSACSIDPVLATDHRRSGVTQLMRVPTMFSTH